MVRWHHQLNGHESEQAMGDGEGQGSLEYCSPWGHKESDMTERLSLHFALYIGTQTHTHISSVAQLCPTLCDPRGCSTPGFPVRQLLPELAQTHAH